MEFVDHTQGIAAEREAQAAECVEAGRCDAEAAPDKQCHRSVTTDKVGDRKNVQSDVERPDQQQNVKGVEGAGVDVFDERRAGENVGVKYWNASAQECFADQHFLFAKINQRVGRKGDFAGQQSAESDTDEGDGQDMKMAGFMGDRGHVESSSFTG